MIHGKLALPSQMQVVERMFLGPCGGPSGLLALCAPVSVTLQRPRSSVRLVSAQIRV